jgi:putative RNA 2'-phosphotransferase
MNPNDLSRVSHTLSWLLRHGANESKLPMDAAGWASVDDVLRVVRVPRPTLDAVVRDNNKSRYELRGERIRACQGHSLAGTPVTLDALEASWIEDTRDELVWHGTSLGALTGIAAEGLLPGERTHVHLAGETDSKVGKRAGVDVLLAVDPTRLRAAGLGLFRSPNGVILARRVPTGCITALRAESRKARADEHRLAGLFNFA